MPTIGAIAYNPFSGTSATGDIGGWNRTWLGPAAFQGRCPWYMTVVNPTTVTGRNDLQEIRDREILYACAGGLDYFIYDFYPNQQDFFSNPANGSPYTTWIDANAGVRLHRTSRVKSRVKYSLLWVACVGLGSPVWGDPSGIPLVRDYFVSCFQEPEYMTVLSGRPLLYLFTPDDLVTTTYSGDVSATRAALDDLRSACMVATGKNPYIVGSVPGGGITNYAALGLDAANYYTLFPTTTNQSYADYKAIIENSWTVFGSIPQVPLVSFGIDFRPISNNPIAGSYGDVTMPPGLGEGTPGNWNAAPTPSEFAAHLTAAIAYVNAHGSGTSSCPADTISIYAWAEPTEAVQGLGPSLGMGTAYLDALASVVGSHDVGSGQMFPVSLVSDVVAWPDQAAGY